MSSKILVLYLGKRGQLIPMINLIIRHKKNQLKKDKVLKCENKIILKLCRTNVMKNNYTFLGTQFFDKTQK